MKKLISFICVVLFSVTANATLISVELDKSTYQVGETVTATVNIVGDFDLVTNVAAFQGSLLVDDELLGFQSVTFYDFLTGGDATASFAGFNKFLNEVEVFEFGSLDAIDLDNIQGHLSEFSLFSIQFTALKTGVGVVDYLSFFVDSGNFNPVNINSVLQKSFTIESSVQVPEPSTIVLFSVLGLLALRRKA